MDNTYIDLQREFFKLSEEYTNSATSDSVDIAHGLGIKTFDLFQWEQLLEKRRVILLSEAGSGKTFEIIEQAKRLHKDKKQSFFLRLEHVSEYFEACFEEAGTYSEFQYWLDSAEEAWIFLDSVDESKLKDEAAFEKAILKLNLELNKGFGRAHIFITSRASAWRPKTDLQFCNKKLPYKNEENAFEVYGVNELNRRQVEKFIASKGVNDIDAFINDVERYNAWAHTARPIDLEDLLEFWNEKKTIGTPHQIQENSIRRRLKEPKRKIEDAANNSDDDVEEAIKTIAASLTLQNKSDIYIRDDNQNKRGINLGQILPSWKPRERDYLLGAALFTPRLYSRVRFHHRSTRELLCAKWFKQKLSEGGSRTSVENIFFAKKYGLDVVRPNMKDVLLWLIILDENIREKACQITPEIIFEAHDPSELPLSTRERAIRDICKKIDHGEKYDGYLDHLAVAKFTNDDVSDLILELLDQYQKNSEIVSLLMTLAWQGKIRDAYTVAQKLFKSEKLSAKARASSLKLIKEFASKEDFLEFVRDAIQASPGISREFLAEIINNLDPENETFSIIISGLKKSDAKTSKRYRTETLSYALEGFVKRIPEDKLFDFVSSLDELIGLKPLIEKRYCNVSKHYVWLLQTLAIAIYSILQNKRSESLEKPVLSSLTRIIACKTYHEVYISYSNDDFRKLIDNWPEFHRALFWNTIEDTRLQNPNKKIDDFWSAYSHDHLWSAEEIGFDVLLNDIEEKSFIDDKHVAFSLAFNFYNNKPDNYKLKKLRGAVSEYPELKKKLEQYLNPTKTKQMLEYEKQEKEWAEERKKRKIKKEQDLENDIKILNKEYKSLENPDCFKKGQITNNQAYLHEKMRESGNQNTSSWTTGDWKSLVGTYGEKVAKSFRLGLLNFWRHYKPKLRSEYNKDNNSVPIALIFGLSGLNLEASENKNWAKLLKSNEVELAFRYALKELNGFPSWFSQLYNAHPSKIKKLLLSELSWELKTKKANDDQFYLLNKISWDAEWLWSDLTDDLFELLRKEPKNYKDLENILKIISKSDFDDEKLKSLVAKKCRRLKRPEHHDLWCAVWLGICPKEALEYLEKYLGSYNDIEDAQTAAMRVIANLPNTRNSELSNRIKYLEPQHLSELYMLMSKYIKPEDDIERAGKGAYTPTLRDHAQEARNHLFNILSGIPGKETFVALNKIGKNESRKDMKLWLKDMARKRAETDANLPALNADQFLELDTSLEFTPTNHESLAVLALNRLHDFKKDIEEGDDSVAGTLLKETEETKFRNFIANWCNRNSVGKYTVTQEEEFADAKRPDLRFHGNGFNEPVPIELKLVNNGWSGADLFERLENQVCRGYMREEKSKHAVFLMVCHDDKKTWDIPNGDKRVSFDKLVSELRSHWQGLSDKFPEIENVTVLGINLQKRFN